MKRIHTAGWVLPILLCLWGFAVWGADADTIWVDEWWSVYYIGATPLVEFRSPITTIERVAANRSHENNPVGYYVVLSLWRAAVGESDFALRLFSGLCSVLTVALIYRLGWAVGGHPVGIAAAVLLGFSAFFVNYSHEMRMYALAALWTALGLLAYWQFMHVPRRFWGWGALLVISAAGLVYTHYGNALMIGLLGLYHLLAVWPKNRRWWQAAGLALLAGGLFLPHLPLTLGIGGRFGEKLVSADSITGGAWSLPAVVQMSVLGFANEQWLFVVLLTVAFAFGLWRAPLSQRTREGLRWSGLLALGGIFTLIAVRLAFETVFHVRYLLALWIPLALFAALVMVAALGALPRAWRNTATAALLIGWIGTGALVSADIHYHGKYFHPVFRGAFTEPNRWDDAGRYLNGVSHPNDAVLVSVGEALAWAHRGNAAFYLHDSPSRVLLVEGNETPPDFGAFIYGAGRVWVAQAQDSPPSPDSQRLQQALTAQGYRTCGDPTLFGGVNLNVYAIAPECCTPPTTTLASYGAYADLRYHRATLAGNSLRIWQGWQVNPTTPANTYSIGWYFLDAANGVIAQRDDALPAPGYTCLLSEFAVPSVDGVLRAGVYDWATGARLATDPPAPDDLAALPYTPE
ncbi:MAG: glycosyltransferase family 39 protein [Phototrophicaceae bacterium]|jgi:hypothetical protein